MTYGTWRKDVSENGKSDQSTVIDLRSDTVTRPTSEMRRAMESALVGDDQYGEDPTVNRLEEMSAQLLGKEAAVLVTSGVQGNLAAVLAHATRGQEVILGDESHILWYESAGVATVGGISPRTVRTLPDGTFDLDELAEAIRTAGPGFPETGLISIENTHNRCGGAVLSLEYMREVRAMAAAHGIPVHLDGARIFNAAAALGVAPSDVAAQADSVQFCFSKALAAPVGSMVVGNADFIEKVRRQRKMLGGAMRQAGIIAGPAIVALETMIDRLPEDHRRARMLAQGIAEIPGLVIDPAAVQSNIVIFRPEAPVNQEALREALRSEGILSSDFGSRGVRLVTHYEISDDDISRTLDVLAGVTHRMLEPGHVTA
jgi:threonine aldolase